MGESHLVIGIDGGASHTIAMLADARTGEALGRGEGGPSNIQAVGEEAGRQAVGIGSGGLGGERLAIEIGTNAVAADAALADPGDIGITSDLVGHSERRPAAKTARAVERHVILDLPSETPVLRITHVLSQRVSVLNQIILSCSYGRCWRRSATTEIWSAADVMVERESSSKCRATPRNSSKSV